MSLSHNTGLLQQLQNKSIPPGKYIGEDERFAETLKPQKMPYMIGESFAREGKPLRPAHFQYSHLNPTFTPVYIPPPELKMNYGTYIYNKVTGYQ
jgi:hypothetical protein